MIKWILCVFLCFGCVNDNKTPDKQTITSTEKTLAASKQELEKKAEEGCEDSKKKLEELESTEKAVDLSAPPTTGCTLE